MRRPASEVRRDRLDQIRRIVIGECPEIEQSRMAWYVRSGWLIVAHSSGCRRRVRLGSGAHEAVRRADPSFSPDHGVEYLITVIDGPGTRSAWLRARGVDRESRCAGSSPGEFIVIDECATIGPVLGDDPEGPVGELDRVAFAVGRLSEDVR